MKPKMWIPLAAALVIGLIAAKMALSLASGNAPKKGSLQTVVVAKQDLEAGRELKDGDVTLTQVPADGVAGKSFEHLAEVVGRVTVGALVKGQPVLDNLLAPAGSGAGLQALVPVGMRAITLEVNDFSGVGGMLVPGCHVDVIATVNDQKSNEMASQTIVQDVKVTAVGKQFGPVAPGSDGPPPTFNNVTLLCTPKQAQVLQLASVSGRPWLVLRSNRDEAQVNGVETRLSELRGDKPQAPAAPAIAPVIAPAVVSKPAPLPDPAPEFWTVHVFTEGKPEDVKFATPAETHDVATTSPEN